MNVTAELNAASVRNDANTTHAVMSHIRAKHAGLLDNFQQALAVQEAIHANDAAFGCEVADRLADAERRIASIRQRFSLELNLHTSL